MPYLSIADFRYGMDRRRERVAGTPGTLWTLENGHLTRGGDIERAKKFASKYTLPAGTFGLGAVKQQLYAFGSDDLAASMPIGMSYQRLQGPGSQNMTAVLDWTLFSGEFYVVAEYDDGNVFHFFNGSRVTDWDTIAAASADYTTLAALMASKVDENDAVKAEPFGASIRISAVDAGTAFTITASAVNGGSTDDQTLTLTEVQANVAAVAEVIATATVTVTGGTELAGHNKVTSITVNGVELLDEDVEWQGTNDATAIHIAQRINNGTATHHYSAVTTNATVTISALAGTGATPNGYAVAVSTSGDIQVNSTDMAGGVTAVAAQQQIYTAAFGGTFEAADLFTITINGTDYKATGLASATGRTANVFFDRVWSPANSLWRYSKLEDPTVFDPDADGSDAGYINVASAAQGNEDLIVAEKYQSWNAIFSAQQIALYVLDTDPANFAIETTLDNTGTTAPKSVIRYGNNDVFYLDPTGIRSLRALNASNAPFVSDVGNSIDTFVQEFLETLPTSQQRAARAVIEPKDGRFWLAVGDRIFVLSFFPSAKISGWSYYSPGFVVDDMVRAYNNLYVRSGDTVYLYGGDDGETYPGDNEMVCTVEWPFLSGNTPATIKDLTGIDLAVTNDWDMEICVDPNRPDKTVKAGIVRNTTVSEGAISVPGRTAIIAAKLTCSRAGRATISFGQIHYELDEAT